MVKEFTLSISGVQRVKGKAAEITSLIDNFDNVGPRKPSMNWVPTVYFRCVYVNQ
jgi:hypothetical protein